MFSKEIIIAKTNWELFKEGCNTVLQVLKESDLHYLFGDNPEEDIVRLRIEEIKSNKL